MKLIPVDPENEEHVNVLWKLFQSRPEIARVSSRGADVTFEQHREFVRNHPYADWCLIDGWAEDFGLAPHFIGAVFLSQPARPSVVGDELSVDLAEDYRGKGYAEEALQMMMEKHGPRRYIANVAIRNFKSMALFQKLGFEPCQLTFEKTNDPA